MLRVTQPSGEQLERKRSPDTHAGQIPRGTSTEEHQGWASVWLWVVEGVGDTQGEVPGRSGSNTGGWCITKCWLCHGKYHPLSQGLGVSRYPQGLKLRDGAPAEPTLLLPRPFKRWAEPNSGLTLRAVPMAMIRAHRTREAEICQKLNGLSCQGAKICLFVRFTLSQHKLCISPTSNEHGGQNLTIAWRVQLGGRIWREEGRENLEAVNGERVLEDLGEEMGTLWGQAKSASTSQVGRCWALPCPNTEWGRAAKVW